MCVRALFRSCSNYSYVQAVSCVAVTTYELLYKTSSMTKLLLHSLITYVIWKQLPYIQAQDLADGAENLRNASLTTLYRNLKYTDVIQQPVLLHDGENSVVGSQNNEYKNRYAYVTPCSDSSVSTIMDTTEGLLAARVFAKSGDSSTAWEIIRGILSAQGVYYFSSLIPLHENHIYEEHTDQTYIYFRCWSRCLKN